MTKDFNGQRFGYDAESHQKEFFSASNQTTTPDATYHYDGEGRRVKKIVGTEVTIFVYDASGQLAAEYSTTVAQVQDAKLSYLTTDHLGSPRIITDAIGAVISRKDFTAFGEEATSAQRVGGTNGNGYDPPNVRQDYTGYQKDNESGLEFAQARYYNAGHGRFTSVDPLTASATIRNPQTFNRYSYVINSPYKFVDPLGLALSDIGVVQTGNAALYRYLDTLGARNLMRQALAEQNQQSHQQRAQIAAQTPQPPPSTEGQNDDTDEQIRARFPIFNSSTDQETVNEAISDASDVANLRGATNPAALALIAMFRNSGDPTTPAEAMSALDATTGVNITRNAEGQVSDLQMQNVFDGRTSTYEIDHDNNPSTGRITVAQYFRTNPTVNASEIAGLIFLSQGFFNQNREGRAKSMIHEGIVHKGFGRDDTDFGATRAAGSQAIDARINRAYRYYRPSVRPTVITTSQ